MSYHEPCTLQHGQQLGGLVDSILNSLGYQQMPVVDSHLCCGSAGTYSIFQPKLSQQLRANKLKHLQASNPQMIVTTNIGCLMYLQK
nr:heterodisulfide reductase-related iron-sulfur binding cluster [Abyssogena phaseoliformis symbiont]